MRIMKKKVFLMTMKRQMWHEFRTFMIFFLPHSRKFILASLTLAKLYVHHEKDWGLIQSFEVLWGKFRQSTHTAVQSFLLMINDHCVVHTFMYIHFFLKRQDIARFPGISICLRKIMFNVMHKAIMKLISVHDVLKMLAELVPPITAPISSKFFVVK